MGDDYPIEYALKLATTSNRDLQKELYKITKDSNWEMNC